MAIGESAGILFKIKADESDAVRGIKNVQDESTKLTAASPFESLTSAAGISATQLAGLGSVLSTVGAGILAVASAAVTTTIGLFSLSQAAANFGSEIFDASEKTGLSAEALSAMKFAADQSGTSLETITAASAKFSKTISEAGRGSEEAQKKLDRLGVTSNDLETALGQALATIVKLPPGTQQMAAAMDAFGKSGADLLPFIKSFDGDLDELLATAKRLGVTIDDEAARAADEFGDTLDSLSAQFAGVGRTIGFAFLPIFLDMAKAVSGFLERNQPEIQAWADHISNQLTRLQTQFSGFASNIETFAERSGVSWEKMVSDMLDRSGPLMIRIGEINRLLGRNILGDAFGGGGGGANAGGGFAVPSYTPPPSVKSSGKASRAREADPAREAEKAERERVEGIRKNLSDEIALRLATDRTRLAQIESFYAEGSITEEQAFERSQKIIQDQLLFKLQAYKDTAKLLADNAKEAERITREIALIEQQAFETAYKQTTDLANFRKKTEKERLVEIDRVIEKNVEILKQEQIKIDLANKQLEIDREKKFESGLLIKPSIVAPESEETPKSGIAQIGGLLKDALGGEDVENLALYQPIVDGLSQSFAQLAQAVGSSVQAFVLFGSAGGSFKKFAAELLASIAQMAAVQAVWNLAEGFAKLALAYFGHPTAGPSATQHFIAAAVYGSIAGIAAVAGRGVAGDSFKKQASGGGSQTGSGNSQEDEEPRPISRQSDDAFTSGRSNGGSPWQRMEARLGEMIAAQREAIIQADINAKRLDGTLGNFESMSAGEVLVKGAQQRKGFISKTAVEEMGRNNGTVNQLVRTTRI